MQPPKRRWRPSVPAAWAWRLPELGGSAREHELHPHLRGRDGP